MVLIFTIYFLQNVKIPDASIVKNDDDSTFGSQHEWQVPTIRTYNACAVVFIHGSSRGLAGFQACFIDSTGKSYGNIQVDLV